MRCGSTALRTSLSTVESEDLLALQGSSACEVPNGQILEETSACSLSP